MPYTLQNNRYPGLDGLRAFSILLVLLPHFGLNYYLRKCGILLNSTLGVHTFFIISGFLITTLLLKEQITRGHISLRNFYARRALRILPLAWLYLIVLFSLNQIFSLHVGLMDFISSALFFKNLPMRNEPFTAHFWSLAVEEQFYLVFPALLAWSPKIYRLFAIFLAFVVPALAIAGHYIHTPTIPILYWLFKISSYLFWKGPVMIMLGSVLSLFILKKVIKPKQIKIPAIVGLILIILAVIISSKTLIWYDDYISTYLSALLIAGSIIFIINEAGALNKLLNNRIMVRIGILSYSIYIWQELFISNRPWQPWLHFMNGCSIWQVMLLKLALMCVIAPLSFKFESVFLRMKSKFPPTAKNERPS